MQWWHVVITFTPPGNFSMFINGRLQWGGSLDLRNNPTFTVRQTVELAEQSTSIQFDSFRYYARAVAESEALAVYTSLTPLGSKAYELGSTATTMCSGSWRDRCGVRKVKNLVASSGVNNISICFDGKVYATSFVGDTVTIDGQMKECNWYLAVPERFRMEHLSTMIAEYRAGFDSEYLYLFVVVQFVAVR